MLENIEVIEALHANLVIAALEVTVEDVRLSPWPRIGQFVEQLDLRQKSLQLALESPERCPTLDAVVGLGPVKQIHEAKSVKSSMVTAQIGRVLLITPPLEQVIPLVVSMNY